MSSNEQNPIPANRTYDLQLEYSIEHGLSLAARKLVLSGPIDEGTFKYISSALTELELLNKKAITIEIKSEGGLVNEALAVVGRIKASPCKIVTIGYGEIFSAATIILAAGDARLMSKYAWLMVHEGSTRISGKFTDLQDEIRQLAREEEHWCSIMQDLTNTPKSIWKELQEKESYLNAQECFQLGVIDKIL